MHHVSVRRPRALTLAALLLTLLVATPSGADAQQAPPPQAQAPQAQAPQAQGQTAPVAAPNDIVRRSMEALRMAPGERIDLDGALDEGPWQRALPAKDFIQVDPQNGQPATEPTEVRIVFDSAAFYIGVTAYDSEPTKWLGYQRRRDEFLGADDRFMWTIDTFLDGRTGYFFEMNPSGLMADALLGINGQNRQWDGIWNARAAHTDFGWVLEIQIPFRTVNFNPNTDTWGINFQRTVRRKNEDSLWMGWARNQGLQRMANAGRVSGITNVSQGHGLDIKPYGLLSGEAAPARRQNNFIRDQNAGIDFFYNPTPLLRANLTINTDFAQTEVDQRQVNLTRFNLFFPERRDFFLDGATFFDFAGPTQGDLIVNPFFSRRIGLTSGTAGLVPQKIDFGTKLTGQVGTQDVGFLHVKTGEDGTLASEDFTAARLKRRILRQSYVGATYTRRGGTGGDARHTVGVDTRVATNRFLGSQNLTFSGWALHAPSRGATSGTWAYGATLDYPNDRWSARFDTREVGDRFDPAIGFVTRTSYRRYSPSLNFNPRPRNNRIVRQYFYGIDGDIQTDLANTPIVQSIQLQPFGVSLQSQENFFVNVTMRKERLDQPFTIRRGITLPLNAEYTFTRVRGNWQTANRRVVAVGGRIEGGQFYSGTRREFVTNLTVRVAPGYIVYLTGEWNSVNLPEGAFTTRLYRVVGETQFTPFIAWVNNIQYDTQSNVAGWQSRFRWIVRPGSDIYVVYTHNWLDDPTLQRFATQDKRIATKALYTYRF
jgi:Domain of unknown function (DUF5916)